MWPIRTDFGFFNFNIFRETVDSLVEESGCRIENPLSQRLRECGDLAVFVIRSFLSFTVQLGEWQKALEIVEKLRPLLSQRQYLTVRVLLLEERFKELIIQGEVCFNVK